MLEFQNAESTVVQVQNSVLVVGPTGSGKTTLIPTLPGKVFAYLFDPNAVRSLAGYDVDYVQFLPDLVPLNIVVQSGPWKTDVGKVKAKDAPRHETTSVEKYVEWENDFYSRVKEGFFDSYDWICIDSITTLSDMAMDRILHIQGKLGHIPETDEYISLVNVVQNIFRSLNSLGKSIYATGHHEMKQDEKTKRLYNQVILTGKLRVKLPLLFAQIFTAGAEASMNMKDKAEVVYTLQTKPDKMTPLVRCTIKDLEYQEDVTIDFTKPLKEQGLSRLLLKIR